MYMYVLHAIPDESRDTPYLNPEMAGERKVPSIREEEEEEGSISNHVPSLSERLGQLRPSKEILEYYRLKMSEHDAEYDKLLQKLEKYKCTFEQVHKSQWEVRQREEEIAELQKSLSDMQVFLFQEREHVLRLYAENDRLKIRELEDRKRIQHLLAITQPLNAETTYLLRERPVNVVVHQHKEVEEKVGNTMSSLGGGRGPGGHKVRNETEKDSCSNCCQDQEPLLLTVEALKAQLEEQTHLCKEQVNVLLEDRCVRMEEFQVQQRRDTERIEVLNDQLHVTQCLLYDSTKDYLDLKYATKVKEREYMAERDQLLGQLEQVREKAEAVNPALGVIASLEESQHDQTHSSVNQLQLQLQQAQQVADNYREQCIALEEECARLREETETSKNLFQQRTDKLTKRLCLMNSRYEALERRRGLEVEGYQSDIKLLRQRLKEMEKQLYKLTLSLSGDQDMEILSQVKKTATRSKRLLGDLQNLKGKVYSLENDVKHVHN